MGRHTHPDDVDDEPALDEPAPARNKTSAVADLHLIMRNPRLLAACIAVVVVPFLCYFAIIVGLHKMYDWALFIGAPMVLAGVLIGALLDRAYGRFDHGPRTPLEAQAAAEPEPAEPEPAEPVSMGAGQSASE